MDIGSYKYIDNKVYSRILEAVELSGVYKHIFFVLAMHSVKSQESGLTMSMLVKGAQEINADDIFVEWAEEFSPFKYSRKKKRMVNDDVGKWRLDQAFESPVFTGKDKLEKVVDKFKKNNGLQDGSVVCLEDLQVFVDKRMQLLDKLIEERVLKNKSKWSFQGGNSDGYFNSLKDEERRVIREYLEKNPAPDSVGPMGTPQSKYRYGTFGLRSMEYDVWRRT